MKKLIDKMYGKPFIIVPNRESIEREIIGKTFSIDLKFCICCAVCPSQFLAKNIDFMQPFCSQKTLPLITIH